MDLEVSPLHKHRLAEIYKELHRIGSKESTFLSIESLLYETITIARQYGNDINENDFLRQLKLLEETDYKETQEKYRKSNQRELVIKRFMRQFKKLISDRYKYVTAP
jgi:hypothetical protein